MDKRRDLSAQIKQLDKQGLEILRLKYGESQSYKEIGEALKMSPAEVGSALFQTLKKLDADGAPSLSEDEGAKILGFIHGELDQSDLQNMATRIEAEPGLRQEFEAWLAVSDELESILAKPSKKPPGAPMTAPRIPRKFLIAGLSVLAIGLALPLISSFSTNEDAPMEEPAPPAPQAEIQPAPEGQTVPPVDNLAPQPEQAQQPADAQQAVAQQPGEPPAAQAAVPTPTNELPPPAEPAPSAGPASVPNGAFEGNPDKKMGVFASKVKVSKNLNTKKVLKVLQQRLDGKPSCVPPKLAHLKTVNVTIKLDAKGGISKMEPNPKNKMISKCLWRLLDDKPVAFKASKKGPTQIALSLKNF